MVSLNYGKPNGVQFVTWDKLSKNELTVKPAVNFTLWVKDDINSLTPFYSGFSSITTYKSARILFSFMCLGLLLICFLHLTGARDAIASAGRCMFGVEPSQMSMLYYLMYSSAAGGFEALISTKENVGGQEFKIKVTIKLP